MSQKLLSALAGGVRGLQERQINLSRIWPFPGGPSELQNLKKARLLRATYDSSPGGHSLPSSTVSSSSCSLTPEIVRSREKVSEILEGADIPASHLPSWLILDTLHHPACLTPSRQPPASPCLQLPARPRRAAGGSGPFPPRHRIAGLLALGNRLPRKKSRLRISLNHASCEYRVSIIMHEYRNRNHTPAATRGSGLCLVEH